MNKENISNAAGYYESAQSSYISGYAEEAMKHTNIYLFRYLPQKKILLVPDRTVNAFGCRAVYENMPYDFGDETVFPEDRVLYDKLFTDIEERGLEYSSAEFRIKSKNGTVWCHTTLSVVVRDSDGRPDICAGIVEDCSEIKLKEQEFLLNTLRTQMIGQLSCGVFAYSLPEHEVLIVNDEAKRMFEYSGDDNGRFYSNMEAHILTADIDTIKFAVADIIRNMGGHVKYVFHSRRKDGGVTTIECVTRLVEFSGKRYVLSVMEDISEREKTAVLLRQERRQYREAVVMNSEYSYSFDVTEGMVYSGFHHSKNKKNMEEILGLHFPVRYDIVLRKWMDIVKPVFLTPVDYDSLSAHSLIKGFVSGVTNIAAEYYQSSSYKYFRKAILLSRDEETHHIMAVVIVTDITDSIREETRKRNELAAANRVLRKQVEMTGAFSSLYFASWEINLEREEISEISVPDRLHCVIDESGGKYYDAVKIMIERFVEGEEYRLKAADYLCYERMAERLKKQNTIEIEYKEKNMGWCDAILFPVRRDDYGNVLSAVLAVKEINSEKKREFDAQTALQEAFEGAKRANAAKTEFLSGMSHDIRTPMNAVIGLTAIAETHIDDKEKVADCLSKISVSSRHLLGIINEVLDMSKIESGKFSLNVEEFGIPDLVDSVITMTRPQIESKSHTLTVNIHNLEHEKVVGDIQRIQQIFMNLLGNSVKYTPEGGKINFSICEKKTNRPRIGCYEFVIADNGIGMSEEYVSKIFEPFTRANDTRVEKIQGSGLGMPIANNIVQMMNGDIKIESKLNEGTRITVTIYLELSNEISESSIAELAECPVLVADDDKDSCESACAILNELGMKGEWVLTGEEAVELVARRHKENNDFFAVILDWKMPNMDGVAAAREIRRTVGSEVPIIIISAYDWTDIEAEAREAGADEFIAKPLFKSRMAYVFKNVIGKGNKAEEEAPLKNFINPDFKKRRALLVEDNELNSEIAGEILAMSGIAVDFASNGKEAVNIMKEAKNGYYDIIFMDIQMPIMDGYSAARAIRELPGEYPKNVPIVAMTANAFAEDVLAAKEAGMNEHIAKPLDFDRLYKILTELISN